MSEGIKEGSTVRLRSGGPLMTITAIGDQYGTLTAWCSWFDGTKPNQKTFPLSSLELDE